MNTFIGIFAILLAVNAIVTCQGEHVISEDIIFDDRFVKTEQQPKTTPGRTGSGRIFNGTDVADTEQSNFKFQIKLITKKPHGTFGCGGCVIGKRLVLTAAHCVQDGISGIIYFGMLNQLDKSTSQQQELEPTNWIQHNGYDNEEVKNDIALILLPNNIEFSDTVGQVELPPASYAKNCTQFVGSSVIISGWGVTDDSHTAPSILKYANVKVAPYEQCEKIFQSSFHSDSMVCADATNSGTCQGDSGGPMVWNSNGNQTVIGVVSFGAEKCEHSTHRVCTCVAAFLDWIREHGDGYF